jgi:conjugative relaxase-like TrwC/TraI family protein
VYSAKIGFDMFTMVKHYAQGKDHINYLTENCISQDYYCEKEAVKGEWYGKLAEILELEGKEITAECIEFKKLVEGINPLTGAKLTTREELKKVKAYDYQCSPDKSISVMATVGGDIRLIKAHEEALKEALGEFEKYIGVRNRKGNKVKSRDYYLTGNMTAGIFTHKSSRDLDPQLHSHVFILNVTYDKKNGVFKAIENADIQKNIGYLGRIYQNSLHRKVKKLGYETRLEFNKKGEVKGFQIKDVSPEINKLYSKRSTAIEVEVEKWFKVHGRPPTLEERNIISKDTRKAKMYEISSRKLLERQKSQLTETQYDNLVSLRLKAEKTQEINKHIKLDKTGIEKIYMTHEKLLKEQISHITERKSTFTAEELKREVLRAGSGSITLEMLNTVIENSSELIKLDKNILTSKEIVREEREIINAVKNGIGINRAVNDRYKAFSTEKDLCNEKNRGFDYGGQRKAVHRILSSKDKYIIFRGVAGSGKSTTLEEVEKGLNEAGVKGLYYAPTSTATENLVESGFKEAKNLASLIVMHDNGLLDRPANDIRNSVIFIDEAGLISTKDGSRLIRIAEKYNCKIIFTGDSRQHSSVERGDFLRLLEQNTNTTKAEVTKILRQKDNPELLKVAEMLSEGRAIEAMNKLDDMKLIQENRQYIKKTADSFVKDIEGGRNFQRAIVSAPTRSEVSRLAVEIRKELKTAGYLKGEDTELNIYKSYNYTETQRRNIQCYNAGDLVTFNLKSGNHRPNETYKIVNKNDKYAVLSDGTKFYPEKTGNKVDTGKESRIYLTENDIIRIGANDRNLNVRNGHLLKIEKIEGREITAKRLDNDFREKNQIKFNSGQFKRFDQGYVLTSYKRQGQTYDIHHVACKRLDAKTAYVLGTREKHALHINTPNKEKLFRSTEWSGNRELATDRLNKFQNKKNNVDLQSNKIIGIELKGDDKSLLSGKNDINRFKAIMKEKAIDFKLERSEPKSKLSKTEQINFNKIDAEIEQMKKDFKEGLKTDKDVSKKKPKSINNQSLNKTFNMVQLRQSQHEIRKNNQQSIDKSMGMTFTI